MRRVLILGGGTAGTISANLIAKKLGREIKRGEVGITVLDADGQHIYQPNYIYVSFKGMNPEKVVKEERSLLHKRVKFAVDPATKIDLEERSVTTGKGRTLEYDHLLIATGARVTPDEIPGFREANLDFYSTPEMAWKVWEKLNQIKEGKIVVGISAVPYKCPPAPVEAAFLVEQFLRKKGLKDKVEVHFVTPLPRPYPSEPINDVVAKLFAERGITVHPFFNVDSVDPQNRVVYSMEGAEIKYDALFMVPYHKAPQAMIDSGIGDADGWIPSDKHTLLVKGRDDAYALGDVADLPTSKSGATAHLEAVVTAKNIIAEIKGNSERCRFTGRTHCPIDVGYRKGLFVITTYEKPTKKVKPNRFSLLLKNIFGRMYWRVLSGSLEFIFDRYYGEDARHCSDKKRLNEG
jgi:sulfide:quinone oxidoreductase